MICAAWPGIVSSIVLMRTSVKRLIGIRPFIGIESRDTIWFQQEVEKCR